MVPRHVFWGNTADMEMVLLYIQFQYKKTLHVPSLSGRTPQGDPYLVVSLPDEDWALVHAVHSAAVQEASIALNKIMGMKA